MKTTSALIASLGVLVIVGCSSSSDHKTQGQSGAPKEEKTMAKEQAQPAQPKVAVAAKAEPAAKVEKMETKNVAAPAGFYALTAPNIDGVTQPLGNYSGKVALVVNVASKCGYTPQYEGLEKLYTELEPKGFVVLGFPSNDFGHQEPGTAEEIKEFCSSKYAVTFPLYAKIGTKADANQSPVYAYLNKETNQLPNWNFCKYLIGKDGKVLGFYPSKVKPDDADLRKAIDDALAAK